MNSQSPALKLSHRDNLLWFLPLFTIPKLSGVPQHCPGADEQGLHSSLLTSRIDLAFKH